MLVATADVAAAKPSPDTIIDSGPATQTNAVTASFTFHSTASGATFVCRLDTSAYVACASPTAFSGLTAGNHTFSVDSTAGGIADPSPATATWTIDLAAPSAPTNLVGTAPSTTSVALTWSAGRDNVAVTRNLINRDGSLLTTLGNVSSFTDSAVAPASTHTYTVQAQDGAGNTSAPSNGVTVTTPPVPDTLIDSGPPPVTTLTNASFTFHSTASGATFTCRLDQTKAGGCTSPRTYTGLSSATQTFTVFATANGVNDPTPAVATWTIDLTPPSTPTGLGAAVTPSSVTLSWTASTDNVGVAGYDIYRGGVLLASVGAVTVYADSTISMGVTYTYTVRARDASGNVSPQSSGVAARAQAPFDSQLTRAPYLTDLVGLHVAINWATDQSALTGSVAYGVVGTGGSCTPSTVVAASRTTISVGTVFEYQWKGDVTLPATGTYCYRVYLGSTDLLAANGSPVFTTQVPFGSTQPFTFVVFGDWGQVDASGQNSGQAALMQQIAGSGALFAFSTGDNGYPNGSQINYGDLQQARSSGRTSGQCRAARSRSSQRWATTV
jgi:chitodextrinase